MTVDFIFELLSSLFPSFSGSEILVIVSMLIPFFALFGFITVYGSTFVDWRICVVNWGAEVLSWHVGVVN